MRLGERLRTLPGRIAAATRTPRGRTTLALALILLLLASYGPVTNDEMDQATAYHNARHGSLKVTEFPPQHYLVPFLDFTVAFNIRYTAETPVGSSFLNFVAIPVGVTLTAVDSVVPLSFLYAALAVGLAYALTGWPAPWRGTARQKTARAAFLFAGLALATWGFGQMPGAGQSPDLPYQEAYIALGATNMALYVASVWLLWPVLRRRVDSDWAAVALLLAVGLGSMMFWAQSAKYHTLSAFLVIVMLWLHDRPHTRRNLLAMGAVAGLAVWNHIGAGTIVVFALLVSEVRQAIRLRAVPREIPRRLVPLGAGGLLGLAPFFAENWYFFRNPFFSSRFAERPAEPADVTGNATAGEAVGNATGDGGSGLIGSLGRIPEIIGSIVDWTGPADFLRNLAYGYVWSKAEGDPIPVLWLSPLLAGFLLFLFLLARRRVQADATTAFALALLVGQTVFYTNYAPKQGFGPDMRFYIHVLPALAVLAARPLSGLLTRTAPSRRRILRNALLLVAGLVALTGLLTAGLGEAISLNSRLQLRGYFLAYAGILLAATAFFAWMSRIRWIKPKPQVFAVVFVTVCLALAGLWNVFYMLSKPTSVAQEERDEFASMVLPAMQPVAEFMKDNLFPEVHVPALYDDNGVIIYDPEHGSCNKDPSPCPTHPNYRTEETA